MNVIGFDGPQSLPFLATVGAMGTSGCLLGLLQPAVGGYALRLYRIYRNLGTHRIGWWVATAFCLLGLTQLTLSWRPIAGAALSSEMLELVPLLISILLLIGMAHTEVLFVKRLRVEHKHEQPRSESQTRSNIEALKEKSVCDAIARPKAKAILRTDISGINFRRGLALLVLLGLIVRVGFFIEHAHAPSFAVPTLDQKYYDTVARMLLEGQDLHELHGFRPLLYPLFLATCYKVGGSWGIDLALFLQHLFGIGTGIVVGLLGARLFRNRLCGLIGGVLFLLAPVPLYFEGELLIEPLYTFLICLGLLLAVHAAASQGWKGATLWMISGALTILISQLRPNILVFLAVYALFPLWRLWRSRSWSALLPAGGLIGAVLMAVPWGFVNMKQSGHFHLLPSAGGAAFYLGNKHAADGMIPELDRRVTYGDRYQDSVEVWADKEYEAAMRAQNRTPDTDPMAISQYWTKRTLQEIAAAPVDWLQLMAKKCWLTLWNVEIPNNKAFAFLQGEFLWLRLLPIRWVVLLMLAPAGIWAALKNGHRDTLIILGIYAALYSAANVAFFVCDRYRYPIWPAMAVFAGGGLVLVFEILRARRFPDAICLFGVMALPATLSLHNWFEAKLPSFARDYLFRSIACYEKGDFTESLKDANQSIKLDAHDATALNQRANALFALKRYDEARIAYQKTLALDPGEAAAWNDLGATLDESGHPDEALDAFRHAIACRPPSNNAFLGIAFIELTAGHLGDCENALNQLGALESSPDAAALAIRSVVARKAGKSFEADTLERQARQLNPDLTAWTIKRALTEGKCP